MDRSGTFVIHYSPNLYNQRLYAGYLEEGFRNLGISTKLTDNPREQGEYHVCIGPHFALKDNQNENTIYIDRCKWGDDLDAVSIGWIREDGGYIYPENCDDARAKPELKPWQDNDGGILFLFDYGPYPAEDYKRACKHGFVTIRPHPATGKVLPSLSEHMEGKKCVIGYNTSALVQAVIEGYPTIALDRRSCVYPVAGRDILEIVKPDRSQWLRNMSYLQWRGAEIRTGEALEYVLKSK